MDLNSFLTFFTGIASASGFLFVLYFLYTRKDTRLKIILLSGFVIAISVRLTMTIIYFIFDAPFLSMAIGLLGSTAIGPFLWLYFKYYDRDPKEFSIKKEWFHFIIVVLGLFPVWISKNMGVAYWSYLTANTLLLAYVVSSWLKFKEIQFENNKVRRANIRILIVVSLLLIAFNIQFFSHRFTIYTIGTAFSSLLLFVFVIYCLKNPMLFPRHKKKLKIKPIVFEKIERLINKEKIYLKPSLTLDKLAKMVDEPTHVVSVTIKNSYNKSFPEYINHLRVKEVIKKLKDSDGEMIKIESLAYTCGFSTPSAFYVAFKKETSMTPSEYRKKV